MGPFVHEDVQGLPCPMRCGQGFMAGIGDVAEHVTARGDVDNSKLQGLLHNAGQPPGLIYRYLVSPLRLDLQAWCESGDHQGFHQELRRCCFAVIRVMSAAYWNGLGLHPCSSRRKLTASLQWLLGNQH